MLAKLRTVLAASGLLLVALLIWYGGPYLGLGNLRPFESAIARSVLIAVVVVCYLASRLLKRLRAASASDKLMSAVVKQAQSDKAQPGADVVQLRERFEEAVATLKQKRRGSHTLYELPWYVIIGAPGSGKTTALVNSGLRFPTEQRSGRGALRGIGGTRNCDWWFTDEAVFLDTAGRYTTQDSDASADSAGWREFLALLRKYRKRRPVNGVILAISAQDLMTQGQAGREAHVAAARQRLDELNQELRIQLPVYLMVTKCDLVAGFTEYFDDMPADARAQVWGVTFPYDDTLKGQAAQSLQGEIDALTTRLTERLLARVEEDHDVRRRTKMFGFPQQMAALREPLCQFVGDVFASTRFDKQILLRGVYFTSGTQEGTPIDRLLGAMVRRFAVPSEAVVPPGKGKAYFIERLLKDVMFAESGLAGVNRRVEVQKAALQLAAYAAMVVGAVAAVIALWVSYGRNRDYLSEVAADVAGLSEVPAVDTSASLDSVLYRLNEVRTVVDSANRYETDTPLAMRWGLFQGRALGNSARDAYIRELNDALLPRVAGRFRQRLIEYTSEPEKLYEYLKGYLMFGNPDRLDPEQLGLLAEYEWDAAYPGDPDLRAAASNHFQSLLEYEDTIHASRLDEAIVKQAQSTIRQASLPGLVYRYLRLDYANDTGRALRLDLASGLGAERVLRRRSGVSLSEPVPSLYTKAVFKEVADRGTDDLVRQFSAEQWVWGDAGPAFGGSQSLGAEVMDLYEKDYIAFWDRVVADLELIPFSGPERTREALAILGSDTSPLRGFLKAVDDNTFLVEPPDPAAARGRGIGDRVGGILNRGRQALGISTAPAPVAGAQVTEHFAQIHRLVTGDAGSAPIDPVLRQIKDIEARLQTVTTNVGGDPTNIPTLASIGEMAKSLQRSAEALPPGIGALVSEVGARSASTTRGALTGTLTSRYQEEVLRPCREVVMGRYPFTPNSATDMQLADFGRVFGYNGVFDTFYKNELEALVERTRRPWRWRTDASGASVGGGFDLSQFELAQRIRDVFFRQGSQEPAMRFTATPVSLDLGAGRFTLEVDGQMLEHRYGPDRAVPMTWPGPNPNTAAATFQQTAGQPNFVADGPWAWFRLIGEAEIARESDTRYVLTFRRGVREARVRVDAATVLNPMASDDWQRFRCG